RHGVCTLPLHDALPILVQAAVRTFGGAVIERAAARPVIERIMAAAQRRSESESVLERSWHIAMFEEREKHVLDSLAQRMRTAGQDRKSTRLNSSHVKSS